MALIVTRYGALLLRAMGQTLLLALLGLFFACILGMIFRSKSILTLGETGFTIMDIVMFLGMLPMYYEMIRLQVKLFLRLKEMDAK